MPTSGAAAAAATDSDLWTATTANAGASNDSTKSFVGCCPFQKAAPSTQHIHSLRITLGMRL